MVSLMSRCRMNNCGCMQDLAATVTQRLPARAQRSVRISTVTESAHPAPIVIQDQQDITATLAGLVRDVLGADVPLHQPFHGGKSLQYCSPCTGLLYAAAAQASAAQLFSHQQILAIVSADCLSAHSIAPRDLTSVMACISRFQAVES